MNLMNRSIHPPLSFLCFLLCMMEALSEHGLVPGLGFPITFVGFTPPTGIVAAAEGAGELLPEPDGTNVMFAPPVGVGGHTVPVEEPAQTKVGDTTEGVAATVAVPTPTAFAA